MAALNRRRAIGLENRLLWHLPVDLQHFKSVTLDRPIVMGRSTHASIGRALPRRTNIVLSRQPGLTLPGCIVVPSLDDALRIAGDAPSVMIIGGAQVYAQAMDRATCLRLTHVDNDFEGDAYFPEIEPSIWHAVEERQHPSDAANPHACRFVTYVRAARFFGLSGRGTAAEATPAG